MGDAADDMFDRAMLEEFEEYIDEDGEVSMTDNKDPHITARYVIDCDYSFSWLFVAGQPENIIVKVNQSEVSHQNLNRIKDAINKDIQQLSSELKQLRAERADEADYFYNADDWDVTYHDESGVLDALDYVKDGIIEIGRLKALPSKFVVRLWDEDGYHLEDRYFDTKEEALDAKSKLTDSAQRVTNKEGE